MSNIIESLEFGTGSFVGQAMHDPEFFDSPIRDQARAVGYADGCPVVEELTDPDNPDPNRGPDVMLQRYSQINFWFGHIARTAQELNPMLGDQLMKPVPRVEGDTLGKYEPESVPNTYEAEMSPMGTLVGYALPRLFIEGIGKDPTPEESEILTVRALDILEDAVIQSESPEQLLALLAEGFDQTELNSYDVLSSVLSPGWLREHGAVGQMDEMKVALKQNSPFLWQTYKGLSGPEKDYLKIA